MNNFINYELNHIISWRNLLSFQFKGRFIGCPRMDKGRFYPIKNYNYLPRYSYSKNCLLIGSLIWVPHKLNNDFKSALHNTKSLHN